MKKSNPAILWAYSIGAGVAILSGVGIVAGILLTRSPWGIDGSFARHLHERLSCENPLIVGGKFIGYLGLPPWFYLLIGGTCVYLGTRRRWGEVAYLLISGLGGGTYRHHRQASRRSSSSECRRLMWVSTIQW